jgi:beta-galactosidase
VKDNFYHSEWSPVYSVSPDQDAFPETPVIQGVTLQKGHAMIHFSPVKKAIGYQLAYRETTQTNSPWKTQVISQSQAQFFSVEGLLPKAGYEFKISAISSQGRSKESSSTKALPSL